MTIKLTDKVSWIGKIDWALDNFHGEQLSTDNGSSYNAYLIRDGKNIIIDTVYAPFTREFLDNLFSQIKPEEIDIIISLHGEPDHSGALPELIKQCRDAEIYCTANGVKSLQGYYDAGDWKFNIVKSGDSIKLDSQKIEFIEANMLHWPDTMMAYLDGDKVLFSSDVFGQHLAASRLFDNSADKAILDYESMKYYANIISPFAKKVASKIKEIKEIQDKINIICPAHGVIWKEYKDEIIEKYSKWSDKYSENQITIVYDSMYGSTAMMAEAIADGIIDINSDITVKIINSSSTDSSDIVTEIFKSSGVIVGSPTINKGMLNSIAALLEELKGLKFSGKHGAGFGSYGWAPMAHKKINESLEKAGFEIIGKGLKAYWKPDNDELSECKEFGKEFINSIMEQ